MPSTWRVGLRTIALIAAAGGCAAPSRHDVVTAPPTRDELPDLARASATIPLSVAVEGADDRPRHLLVAPPAEPVLTARERKLLGLDQQETYDPLELYRPPRGPQDGVDPTAGGLRAAISGWAGAAVGLVPFAPVWGVGSALAGAPSAAAPPAGALGAAGPRRERVAEAGGPAGLRVGNRGRPRAVAGRYPGD